ncbi:hypothetical protein [Lentzea jiangxiensis]|uniref:hypothetical protein n=1 Tax=Lentzea jiangxiensis TaxID=641025 RepID=UPI0015A2B6F5|nr:hypothetical protein [Lentzea jiangxiensis]
MRAPDATAPLVSGWCCPEGDLIPGVYAPVIGDTADGVQRCDQCCYYGSDLDAALALACHIESGQVWFRPQDATEAVRYDGTPTALILDRHTDPWITTANGAPVEWTFDLIRRLWNQPGHLPG